MGSPKHTVVATCAVVAVRLGCLASSVTGAIAAETVVE
jgi:hypothetical protein